MTDALNETAAGDWLMPTEALNRFQLSEDDLLTRRAPDIQAKRYGVRLGSIGMLLPHDTVSEVLTQEVVYPIPNTAPWLSGIVNLRGNLVPVFELRQLLDTEAALNRHQMIAVVDKGEKALGFEIDGFPDSVDTEAPLTQMPPLPSILQEFAKAAYLSDDTVWLDVDVRDFVDSLSGGIGV
jgi:twitching motility protein PilI